MPTTMLLRSLFIATVSSNKFLLIPSLHLLSFFAKPNRSFLFNVDRNPVLKSILKRTLYNQFCAGESEQETKECVRQLKDLGFKGVILTFAKETVFDHRSKSADLLSSEKPVETAVAHDADIETWRVGTLKTVDLISAGDILALKTTGGGLNVTEAFSKGEFPPQQMLDALDEIAVKCKQRGIQIIVDAESQHWQKGIGRTTLELMRKFNTDGKAVIYNTYQAYLKNTPAVLAHHMAEAEKDGFTLGLKLVRGAYITSDDRSLIHDTKEDTDNAYNGIAQGALRREIGEFGKTRPFPSVNLFLASHNRDSVLSANKMHRHRTEAGLPTVPVAFAQLHGMSDEVSFSLLAEKGDNEVPPEVFKCTTWGSMGDFHSKKKNSSLTASPGNLGTPILKSLISAPKDSQPPQFSKFFACIHSEKSEQRLTTLFRQHIESSKLSIFRGDNVNAVKSSTVIILGVDPSAVESTLREPGLAQALQGKLLISVAAGWSRQNLEALVTTTTTTNPSDKSQNQEKTWVLRTLPNIASLVSQSLTAIELPPPDFPPALFKTATAILSTLGPTLPIPPSQMDATTAVAGSTPAFLAIIADALIDAAVATGLPRGTAQTQIYQVMAGTAAMLQSGMSTGELRDAGTSSEGCTIAGVMVLEEGGVRGVVGKALRESVTVARAMGREGGGGHVNDTRF
ncbi:FAD-linked oxidoreductase [Plenodomus tracheiphilus IPT5]|uniref:Proline dehydrogenase n=1 Tax=Plenodomus tracheiphilus IPT5 TaxID=1408161 RepID=A0A6A7B9D6_9PLEO|nr:FAD-linked oxidoreductase [Plenodomus tracheiphilus IPT5]